MIYSIWEGKGITLIPGEGPPRFVDGSLQDETAGKIAQFDAESWEEACEKMDDRLGFEPCTAGPAEENQGD